MSFNLNNLIRDNLKGLQAYSSARDEYVSDGSQMVFLDANENPFENGVNRYPDPQQRSLKTILAKQRDIDSDQILLGNGSDEVLDLLFRAFCEPAKDVVISLPPTYGMYKVLAGINDIENVEVPLTSGFEPDTDAIKTAITETTKIIFLCSPNNPTGNSFSMEKIKELLTSFHGLVVVDEAYIDFSSNVSWVEQLNAYPNLVVTQTLSKAYGMAGIRLGVCYGAKDVISILNKIKPPYNVNELTQKRAMERVLDTKGVRAEVQIILEERKKLITALNRIAFVVKVYPTDANFVLVKVDNADRRYKDLIKKGIVVRNRTNQPGCEDCLRFTIGTPEENKVLLNTLEQL